MAEKHWQGHDKLEPSSSKSHPEKAVLVLEKPLIKRSGIIHLKKQLWSDLQSRKKKKKKKRVAHTQSVRSPRINGNPSRCVPNENSSEHAT